MYWIAYIHIPGDFNHQASTNNVIKLCTLAAGAVEKDKDAPGVFLDLGTADPIPPLKKLTAGLTNLDHAGQVAVGLSKSKFLAKALCLSALNHHQDINLQSLPGGILAVPLYSEENYLLNLPVQFLWPLDDKIKHKLLALGLKKVEDIYKISPHMLKMQFGSKYKKILKYCRGKDLNGFNVPGQCIHFTHNSALYNLQQLHKCLQQASTHLAAELKKTGSGCGTLSITLYFSAHKTAKENRKFNRTLWSEDSLWEALHSLAAKFTFECPVKKVTVKASHLAQVIHKQAALFTADYSVPNGQLNQRQIKIVTGLQHKHGFKAIDWGSKIDFSRQEKLLSRWDPLAAKNS